MYPFGSCSVPGYTSANTAFNCSVREQVLHSSACAVDCLVPIDRFGDVPDETLTLPADERVCAATIVANNNMSNVVSHFRLHFGSWTLARSRSQWLFRYHVSQQTSANSPQQVASRASECSAASFLTDLRFHSVCFGSQRNVRVCHVRKLHFVGERQLLRSVNIMLTWCVQVCS